MIHYPADRTVTLCSRRIYPDTDVTKEPGRITCSRCVEMLEKINRLRGRD